MTTLQTAAQQALEALRGYRREIGDEQPCDAEVALEAALEQPKQKPYLHFYDYDGPFVVALMAPRDQVTAGQFRVISRAIEAKLKELNHD